MQKIYYQQDCNLEKLSGKTVTVTLCKHCFGCASAYVKSDKVFGK